jgi:mRNA interferase RelE/StbE
MINCEIEFSKSAQKELKKLLPQTRLSIVGAIDKLVINPRKGNVRPMVGVKSWRLRVGEYRVVYDIYDKKLVILIIKVRHRKDAYRR